ncbi:hypothetical protein L1887_53935 [Cichorium endivia]|nr:hypothetical protein L1887_53935 [Cichorium endivia]
MLSEASGGAWDSAAEAGDGLGVERKARVGVDVVLDEDLLVPDEACLVKGHALGLHDCLHILCARRIEAAARVVLEVGRDVKERAREAVGSVGGPVESRHGGVATRTEPSAKHARRWRVEGQPRCGGCGRLECGWQARCNGVRNEAQEEGTVASVRCLAELTETCPWLKSDVQRLVARDWRLCGCRADVNVGDLGHHPRSKKSEARRSEREDGGGCRSSCVVGVQTRPKEDPRGCDRDLGPNSAWNGLDRACDSVCRRKRSVWLQSHRQAARMVVVGQPVAKLSILDSTQPPIQPPPGNGPVCLHYSTAMPHPPRRMRNAVVFHQKSEQEERYHKRQIRTTR